MPARACSFRVAMPSLHATPMFNVLAFHCIMKPRLSFSRLAQLIHPLALRTLAAACVMVGCTNLAAAEQGTSADELLNDAGQVLQQLDTDRFAALWQDAAPFVKASVSADKFASQMQQARQSVGSVSRRGWASVTRIQYNGAKGVPDGLYANVDYATTVTSGRTLFELVSFRLGEDGHWHLTGYSARSTQDAAATQTQIAKP
jgi:hypothetical protein